MVSSSICPKLPKYSLFIFNSIFVLTGVLLTAVGLATKERYDAEAYGPFAITGADCHTDMLSIFFLFIGCLVFFLAIFGCWGPLMENHCLTLAFGIAMVLIMVAEVLIVMYAYSLASDVKNELVGAYADSIHAYGEDDAVTRSWDYYQRNMTCCGAHGASDWKVVFPNCSLPKSCCDPDPYSSDVCWETCDSFHKTPCIDAMADMIKQAAYMFEGVTSAIGYAGIIIAVIQLLNMVFACNLAYSIRKDRHPPLINFQRI